MNVTPTRAAAVAALVVLAGCAGAAGPLPGSGSGTGETGTVSVYVSDQRNAIDDFEHLNVTVTQVGFVPANETDDVEDADANETDEANETDDAETITRDVPDRTVDLTDLEGANATVLGNVSVPEGEYRAVVLHVESVNGTLTNGESQRVKLPSERLRVVRPVTVSANATEEYVFDVTVFEAGGSGKYILRPVAGESGTDVEIERVGGGAGERPARGDGDGGQSDRGEGDGAAAGANGNENGNANESVVDAASEARVAGDARNAAAGDVTPGAGPDGTRDGGGNESAPG